MKVSLTGRAKDEGNRKGDGEDPYHGEEDQISTRNQAFHGGELKSPWRGPRSQDSCLGERERDSKRKLILERASHGSVLKTHRSV
jgi:hypothetical protein